MQQQGIGYPRVIISALRGGSGKTLIAIGIMAALRDKGLNLRPFKKGPDYIDAGWLALAAGQPCYNLDTFLIGEQHALDSFQSHFKSGDIAIIEGNRGLYDGMDVQGSVSTAALAHLLNAPVILCIDCTKSTRTIAAIVMGCLHFDPQVQIKGIILNQIAGLRHETIIRESIETRCNIPVIGAIPKLRKQLFPERHMGLVPTPEHSWATTSIKEIAQIAKQHIDLDAIVDVARTAERLPFPEKDPKKDTAETKGIGQEKKPPRIGIFKDAAFSFYYPENIDALVSAGAEPVFISPMKTDDTLSRVDAIYIGGGFPETHAKVLADNRVFREKLQKMANAGLPIYAECGGLMYLGEALVLDGETYPMAGIFPVTFGISKRPQGHGYTIVRVERQNPFFEIGTQINGHEFHYSKILSWRGTEKDLVFSMKRGTGFIGGKDGLVFRNVLATYTHLHATGTPQWIEGMMNKAMEQRTVA